MSSKSCPAAAALRDMGVSNHAPKAAHQYVKDMKDHATQEAFSAVTHGQPQSRAQSCGDFLSRTACCVLFTLALWSGRAALGTLLSS